MGNEKSLSEIIQEMGSSTPTSQSPQLTGLTKERVFDDLVDDVYHGIYDAILAHVRAQLDEQGYYSKKGTFTYNLKPRSVSEEYLSSMEETSCDLYDCADCSDCSDYSDCSGEGPRSHEVFVRDVFETRLVTSLVGCKIIVDLTPAGEKLLPALQSGFDSEGIDLSFYPVINLVGANYLKSTRQLKQIQPTKQIEGYVGEKITLPGGYGFDKKVILGVKYEIRNTK